MNTNQLPTYLELVNALLAAEELADLYQDLCTQHFVPGVGDGSEESAERVALWESIGAVIERLPEGLETNVVPVEQTPPWHIGQDNAGNLEIKAPGVEGTDTIAYMTGEDDPNMDAQRNACRIVAAVNIFRGISTEALVQMGVVSAP